MSLTPQLERAGHRLVEPGNPTLLYRRRYLPIGLVLVAMLAGTAGTVEAASTIASNPRRSSVVLATVVVAVGLVSLMRRSEMLAVTVLPRTGGSVAMVAGYASDTGQFSIRNWRPSTSAQQDAPEAAHPITPAILGTGERRPTCDGA